MSVCLRLVFLLLQSAPFTPAPLASSALLLLLVLPLQPPVGRLLLPPAGAGSLARGQLLRPVGAQVAGHGGPAPRLLPAAERHCCWRWAHVRLLGSWRQSRGRSTCGCCAHRRPDRARCHAIRAGRAAMHHMARVPCHGGGAHAARGDALVHRAGVVAGKRRPGYAYLEGQEGRNVHSMRSAILLEWCRGLPRQRVG